MPKLASVIFVLTQLHASYIHIVTIVLSAAESVLWPASSGDTIALGAMVQYLPKNIRVSSIIHEVSIISVSDITCRRQTALKKPRSLERGFFMAPLVGLAFLRKSHGGCNSPPDCCQEPPFESILASSPPELSCRSLDSHFSLF